MNVSTLVDRAGHRDIKITEKETWLNAVEEARGEALKNNKELAKIYAVEPMLFHGFLYPAVSNVIVVRSQEAVCSA
jgi:hypothetical protein